MKNRLRRPRFSIKQCQKVKSRVFNPDDPTNILEHVNMFVGFERSARSHCCLYTKLIMQNNAGPNKININNKPVVPMKIDLLYSDNIVSL